MPLDIVCLKPYSCEESVSMYRTFVFKSCTVLEPEEAFTADGRAECWRDDLVMSRDLLLFLLSFFPCSTFTTFTNIRTRNFSKSEAVCATRMSLTKTWHYKGDLYIGGHAFGVQKVFRPSFARLSTLKSFLIHFLRAGPNCTRPSTLPPTLIDLSLHLPFPSNFDVPREQALAAAAASTSTLAFGIHAYEWNFKAAFRFAQRPAGRPQQLPAQWWREFLKARPEQSPSIATIASPSSPAAPSATSDGL
jgi:hypothetical protein